VVVLWVGRLGLLAAVVLPLAGGVVGRLRRASFGCALLSWAAAAAALTVTVLVAVHGSDTVSLYGALRLVADPVSVVVLVLVTGVGAVVQSFSARYLQTDPSAERFAVRVGAVVTAMTLVAASGDLAGLVVGWTAAGVAFLGVLSCRRDLPGVAGCTRALRRALVTGDGCLLVAAGLVWAKAGDVRLGSPHALAVAATQLGAWRGLVAVLVTVAALARGAQGVFSRWLPQTVSAPTPSCALLHAGVVNGGGVLLVRLGALGAWAPAMVGLLVVSGATAIRASLLVRRQADVKGQLAYSTMAQMGFMLAECAVGAYAAAVIHLVGHGCYKASLFFSSGSTVRRPGRLAAGVAGASRPGVLAATVSLAIAAAVVPGLLVGDGGVLALYAAVTAAALVGAVWASLPAGPGSGRGRWSALLFAAAVGYGAVVAAVGRFLAHGAATPVGTVDAWWLGALAVAAVGAARLAHRGRWATVIGARLLDTGAPVLGCDGLRRGRPMVGVPTETTATLVVEGRAA
jgi:NAD(P)H-quinone oxidoreductase subunit 5